MKVVALIAGWALSTLAAEAGVGIVPGEQSTAARAADLVAEAWGEGDAQALRRLLAESGVDLSLQGEVYRALDGARVATALEAFFHDHRPRAAEVRRVSRADGSPPRAFAEISWQWLGSGSMEEKSGTLFVGLEQMSSEWRVNELRVVSR